MIAGNSGKRAAQFRELIAREIADLSSNTDGARSAVYERIRDMLLAHQDADRAALEKAICSIETEQTPEPSASEVLWRHARETLSAFVKRYWLLFSQPRLYFEKFIGGASAADLRRTILHSFYGTAIIAGAISLLVIIVPLSDKASMLVTQLVAKGPILYALFLINMLPSFIVSCIFYKMLKCPINDLVFIYFNLFTLGLVMTIIFLVYAVALITIMQPIGGLLSSGLPANLLLKVGYFTATITITYLVLVMSILILVVPYYVGVILIEKSTRRSIFLSTVIFITSVGFGPIIAMQYSNFSNNFLSQTSSIESPNLDYGRQKQEAYALALNYVHQGKDLMVKGRHAEALQSFQKSLATLDQLSELSSDEDEWQEKLAVEYTEIARLFADLGETDNAVYAYRKAIAITEDRSASEEDSLTSSEEFGDQLVKFGRPSEAHDLYAHALIMAEQLTASDSTAEKGQMASWRIYRKIGDLAIAGNQREEALDAYSKAFEIIDSVPESEQAGWDWQKNRMSSLIDLVRAGDQRATAIVRQLQKQGKLNGIQPDQKELIENLLGNQ